VQSFVEVACVLAIVSHCRSHRHS